MKHGHHEAEAKKIIERERGKKKTFFKKNK